jgi:hypothetical protein
MSTNEELPFEKGNGHAPARKNGADTVLVPAAPSPSFVIGTSADCPDFDWDRDSDSIVVPAQPAIAVYFNPRGEVVIRQEAQLHPDEDHYVFLHIKNLPPLISRLQQIVRGEK